MTFSDLGLIPELLRAVADKGYDTPTPIQAQAIPAVLSGRDVLAGAQTGTGKTAGFVLPLLQQLRVAEGRAPRVLVLSPTRELTAQIADNAAGYGRYMNLRTTVIFGGVSERPQIAALKHGCDLLIATPGRLLDLVEQGVADLSNIRHFVLDEADRMLDMGFIHDVKKILKIVPPKRQNLFFSATMPDEVSQLAHDILKNPIKVEAQRVSSTNENIEQHVYFVETADKLDTLIDIVQSSKVERALVFVKMKWQANRISEKLDKAAIPSAAIHGNKSQNARQKALQDFKTGDIKVLVASDLAARGLDVTGISHVFNYDLPDVAETYVHRIGRTGRGGATGTAIAFCSVEDAENLKDIEKLIGQEIPRVLDHSRHSQAAEDSLLRWKSNQRSRPGTPGPKSPSPQNKRPMRSSQNHSNDRRPAGQTDRKNLPNHQSGAAPRPNRNQTTPSRARPRRP